MKNTININNFSTNLQKNKIDILIQEQTIILITPMPRIPNQLIKQLKQLGLQFKIKILYCG